MNNQILWDIIEFFSNLFECVIFLSLPMLILKISVSKVKNIVYILLAVMVLMLIEYSENVLGGIKDFLFPIGVLAYSMIALKGNLIQKISLSVISTSFSTSSTLILIFIFSYMLNIDRSELVLNSDFRFLIIVLTRISILITATILYLFVRKNNELSSKQWLIIAISFLICDWINILIHDISKHIITYGTINLYMGLIAVGVTIIAYISFFMIAVFSKENRIKTENDILLTEKKFQKQSLIAIKNNKEELSHIKHDLSNYLVVINGLIKNKKYDDASENCEKIIGKIDTISNFIECNLLKISIMLNEKLLECRKNNIDTKCVITNTFAQINEIDLTIILSNLINNAIDYELTIAKQKRKINISIIDKQMYIQIIVSNYIEESVLKNNPQLNTTKMDKKSHGIGHKSTQRLVELNNGIIKYYETDNNFNAEILFPC